MNANDIRKISEANIDYVYNSMYNTLIRDIEVAASKGLFQISKFCHVNVWHEYNYGYFHELKIALENDGYICEMIYNKYNPNIFKVSWDNNCES